MPGRGCRCGTWPSCRTRSPAPAATSPPSGHRAAAACRRARRARPAAGGDGRVRRPDLRAGRATAGGAGQPGERGPVRPARRRGGDRAPAGQTHAHGRGRASPSTVDAGPRLRGRPAVRGQPLRLARPGRRRDRHHLDRPRGDAARAPRKRGCNACRPTWRGPAGSARWPRWAPGWRTSCTSRCPRRPTSSRWPCAGSAPRARSRRSSPPVAEAMAEASGQVLRAGEIVQRLRGFIEEAEMQPTLLAPFLREAAEAAWQHSGPAGARLHLQLDETLQALIDPVSIQQVVSNLVRNAADALAADGGDVWVVLEPAADGSAMVSVLDTGRGIDPGDAERLFDVFSGSSKKDGLGSASPSAARSWPRMAAGSPPRTTPAAAPRSCSRCRRACPARRAPRGGTGRRWPERRCAHDLRGRRRRRRAPLAGDAAGRRRLRGVAPSRPARRCWRRSKPAHPRRPAPWWTCAWGTA